MSWFLFWVTAYVVLVLDVTGPSLWSIGQITPHCVLILAVFIGLMASPATVVWAFLFLGVLVDLNAGLADGIDLIGPSILAYLTGAYVVLQMRAMVFRESLAALAVMVFAVGTFVELVTVAVLFIRSIPWIPGESIPNWNASEQLVRSFFELIYSSIAALPIGFVLLRTVPAWGFQTNLRAERRR